MKTVPFLTLTLAGAVLSSCVYYNPLVKDMPYKPRAQRPAAATAIPNTWATEAPGTVPGTAIPTTPAAPKPAAPAPAPKPAAPATAPKPAAPAPAPKPATPAPKPAPKPQADKPLDLTKPVVTPEPTPAPTPAPAPEPKPEPTVTQPAPAPAPEAPKPAVDKKSITNEGPIPVATRVEGDPLRVYNPLDPSKTIRVTDKNGNPQPSGKKLKVPGTNFLFYVP